MMITAILWALIICLFGTDADSPNNHRFATPKNRASNEDTVAPNCRSKYAEPAYLDKKHRLSHLRGSSRIVMHDENGSPDQRRKES